MSKSSKPNLYSSSVQQIKDGTRIVDEQYVIVGEKGIKIKYYCVKNDDIEKIVITGKDGEYTMKKTKDNNTVESKLNNKDLLNELKDSKLKFAKDYIKDSLKGGSKGGAKRSHK